MHPAHDPVQRPGLRLLHEVGGADTMTTTMGIEHAGVERSGEESASVAVQFRTQYENICQVGRFDMHPCILTHSISRQRTIREDRRGR